MSSKRPLMGVCPIGKFVFSHEDAIRQKTLLLNKLREWDVSFVDLEGVLEDGLVRSQDHVDAVVDHFRKAGVDCLFVPHCNFGTEGAVGMIAHKLGVPALLWGPRDETPLEDGSRLRDTLCGLFASSKVLHKLGVRYAYVENCRVDDPALEEGVTAFLGAVNAAAVLTNGVRVGHIGQRIDFFWSTIVNESELLEKFNVEIQPIDMMTFIRDANDRAEGGRTGYEDEVKRLRAEWTVEHLDNAAFINVLAVRDQMLALGEDLGLDAFAVQDFTSLVDAMGAYCFMANAWVAEQYAVGLESDIHGAVSGLLLQRASLGQAPSFLVDLTVRHPENDNAVLLWHAGAPPSLCASDGQVRLGKHWILPSPLSGMTHFQMKQGAITCARFDGDRGTYQLAVGEGRSTPGPDTLNNYVWMEVDDWPHWERTVIEGPFMHHIGMAYGEHGRALKEACRFVPDVELVELDG